MNNDAERKARLAQALRDNLRRRKAQARAQAETTEQGDPTAPGPQGEHG